MAKDRARDVVRPKYPRILPRRVGEVRVAAAWGTTADVGKAFGKLVEGVAAVGEGRTVLGHRQVRQPAVKVGIGFTPLHALPVPLPLDLQSVQQAGMSEGNAMEPAVSAPVG